MDNTTTNLKHIAPSCADRLVHSSLLGKLFAEITIASIYNPNNAAIASLKTIADEMRSDLISWRSAPVDLDAPPRHRNNTDMARVMDETAIVQQHRTALDRQRHYTS